VYPNPLTLLRLCKLLKIPIEELLDFRDYDIGVQDTESNPQRKDSKEKEEIRQKINGLQKVIDEMKKTTQIPLLESMVLELKKQL
jgi:hypothetical protein